MPNPPLDLSELRRLHEAACAIAANATDTYRARNGRQISIEADDGEKCWIVHSDDFEALCSAAAAIDPALLSRIEDLEEERSAILHHIRAEAQRCHGEGTGCLSDAITAEGDALTVIAAEIEAGKHLPTNGGER
ncbi:hypothetical protein LZK98_11695 [Sphingomonas cannabina]|uniref:hypothetical protein n=1 Tax=Sphingomonas cannabina TaxID=2899123 RepID=UPI001F29095B|nr:hypothetical protein [Sphingomonas cannabina]UIJ43754.1 hypothetical protein LZK98_11695 [Sphingomonas cannabina]